MIPRYEIINYLTAKFKDCKYLEIGSLYRENFNLINAKVKHDVEPNPRGFIASFKMLSDKFFKDCQFELIDNKLVKRMYDVIFIDGSHLSDQVIRDVHNSMNILSDDGFIVMHDCFPTKKEWQERHRIEVAWCGDVWKAQAWLCDNFLNVYTIKDSDCGCGVIKGKINFERIPDNENLFKYRFEDLCEGLIRTIEWDKFKQL